MTYPCCDKYCHSDNSQMYSLIWQQESIWSHSADILSAWQYLNQPKDDAIIFSRPPRWDLADVDHKTQNTVFQIPCFVSSGRRMSSVWASLLLWFCNIYMVPIHSVYLCSCSICNLVGFQINCTWWNVRFVLFNCKICVGLKQLVSELRYWSR